MFDFSKLYRGFVKIYNFPTKKTTSRLCTIYFMILFRLPYRRLRSLKKLYSTLLFILLANSLSDQINPTRHLYQKESIIPESSWLQHSMDSVLLKYYNAWKDTFIKILPGTDQCYAMVYDNKHKNEACVSESQGYGMMIVAMMG